MARPVFIKFPTKDVGAAKAFNARAFRGGRRFHFLDPGGNELAAFKAD